MEFFEKEKIVLRHPNTQDASSIKKIVEESKTLDVNSTYLYLILCRDFSSTCLVAEYQSEIAGFITGYNPPENQDVAFVWQVAVQPALQGREVGALLLREYATRMVSRGTKWLEATVSPSNQASLALFKSFARKWNVPFSERPGFAVTDFGPSESHEPEPRIRLGPFVSHGNEKLNMG